eukprot:2882506-Amphidinium_carterae.1
MPSEDLIGTPSLRTIVCCRRAELKTPTAMIRHEAKLLGVHIAKMAQLAQKQASVRWMLLEEDGQLRG